MSTSPFDVQEVTPLDGALNTARLNIRVAPVKTGMKFPPINDFPNLATTDEKRITEQAIARPDYSNWLALAESNGICFIDEDQSKKLHTLYEQKYGEPYPKTRATQSQVDHRQSYWRQTDRTRSFGNRVQGDFLDQLLSFRQNNQYCMAEGSRLNPSADNGPVPREYILVDDSPIAEMPEKLMDLIESLLVEKTATDKKPNNSDPILQGGRNTYLTSRGGKLRQDGLEYEEILSVLSRINTEQCQPPLSDSDVETISRSVSRYEIGKDTTVFSSAKTGAEPKPDQAEAVANWRDSFRTVGELEAGEVRMMINNFIPEGVTFIGGLPGEGKTLLALSIAKALTTGRNFLGDDKFNVPSITPVLYLIPESGARAFRSRCERFGIPNDEKLFLCRTVSEGLTLPLKDPILWEAIKVMKPVVFMDTLIRFSESKDENAAMQNKQVTNDISILRNQGAVSVVALHHATKAMREKGMSLETVLRGTGDIAAFPDAVYGLLRDEALYNKGNGPIELDVECVKPRDFDPPLPFRIAAKRKTDRNFIGEARGIESVIDVTGDFTIVYQSIADREMGAQLVGIIEADPEITIKEIHQQTHISEWEIRKNLRKLGWTKPKDGKKSDKVWTKTSPCNSTARPVDLPSEKDKDF